MGRSGVSAKQDLSSKTPRKAPMSSQMPCAASAGIGNPRHKATPAMPFRAGFGGKIVEGWIIPFVASLLVFDGVSYLNAYMHQDCLFIELHTSDWLKPGRNIRTQQAPELLAEIIE